MQCHVFQYIDAFKSDLPILSVLDARGTLHLTVNSLFTKTWTDVYVYIRERERESTCMAMLMYYTQTHNTYIFRLCWNSCIWIVFTGQKVVPCSTGGGCCYGNLSNNDRIKCLISPSYSIKSVYVPWVHRHAGCLGRPWCRWPPYWLHGSSFSFRMSVNSNSRSPAF